MLSRISMLVGNSCTGVPATAQIMRSAVMSAAATAAVINRGLVASISSSSPSCSGGYYSKDDYPDAGPGSGPRSRSMQQAVESGVTSNTSGRGPPRSPDAPADPADLQNNRGSDPDLTLRTAGQQADQAMAGGYQHHPGPDTGGSLTGNIPHMTGRFAEKVFNAAEVAAQAATGAASVMSDTVKAATGAAVGLKSGHRGSVSHPSGDVTDGTSAPSDQSPVSDDSSPGDSQAWGQQWPDTNSDTRRAGELDTAGGTADEEMLRRKTEQGGYKEAANRLMDIEGLPRKY